MPFSKKRFVAAFVAISLTAGLCSALSSCKKQPSAIVDDCLIEVEYADGKIFGKSTYTLTNRGDNPFDDVRFNLYANAYRKGAKYSPVEEKKKADVFKGGYGGITVEYARADGNDAAYEICGEDDNILSVKTDEYFPDEKITVEVGFTTVLPSANLRLGKTSSTINLADFYPVPCKIENGERVECLYSPFGDPYYSDVTDYSVSLTVPSAYTVAASGYPEKTTVDGEKTTYEYSLCRGRDFACVLSENFEVCAARVGDVTVTAYSAKGRQEKASEIASDALAYFTKTFGKFPYKCLSIAETPFMCGGMEYSGLCYIADNLDDGTSEYAILHEVAHQWWHGGVGNDQINAAYIDEGLAEFSVWLYLTENGRKSDADAMAENAKSTYKAYFDLYKTLGGEANTCMQRPLDEFSSVNEYVAVSYDKSLLAFTAYADAVGLAKTKRNLKKLYETNLFKNISLTDITSVMGLKEHFISFVDGKVLI